METFSGPNLLQSLIGNSFRFYKHQIVLSTKIKAMFPQFAVPGNYSKCLQFLLREDPAEDRNLRVCNNPWLYLEIADLCKLSFIKWRKKTRKSRKMLSKLFSKISKRKLFQSLSEKPKEQLKSTKNFQQKWIKFEEMENEWHWGQVKTPRSGHVNQSCENFRGRTAIILNLFN